jgi:DnaJ-class molecular chaperone
LKALEVTPPTTKTTVKKQYLSLAKKYHPDSTEGGSEEKFVEISKAYDHLRELSDD